MLKCLVAPHSLAAAVLIGVDQLVTYDGRMSDAGAAYGLSVVSPAP